MQNDTLDISNSFSVCEPETLPALAAFRALGISRTAGYESIRRGDFPLRVIKVGKRLLVSRRELDDLLNPQPRLDESEPSFEENSVFYHHGQRTPVVFAEPHGEDQIRMWCPYCDKYHYHGKVGESETNLGHRVAHCIADDSPYKETGYELRLVDKLPKPGRRYRLIQLSNGRYRSGFLAAQRKALNERASENGLVR